MSNVLVDAKIQKIAKEPASNIMIVASRGYGVNRGIYSILLERGLLWGGAVGWRENTF
jgi:hypothetical protein